MKKIGIVVAHATECENLLIKLGKCEIINLYGDFFVRKFALNDKEIYFAESNAGEIRAAITTQILIDRFNIDCVINFGVAGGLKKGTRGNIYIVTGVGHYDFDTSAIDDVVRGQYEIFDSAVIGTDNYLIETAKRLLPTADYAVCASGDKFISDPEFKEGLIKDFSASVCEMEAAGVLITAKLANIPCAVIKIVSDDDVDASAYRAFFENMTDALDDLIVRLIAAI